MRRCGLKLWFSASLLVCLPVPAQTGSVRLIQGDMQQVKGPRDQAFRLCVGSAHAGLELAEGNRQQLAQVHRELGFEFVRFHGIFTDDMHVYSEKDGKPVYDWTRVDALYDSILATGMKPFVELSFMPKELAGGTQLQFYWNANVTPPRDMRRWADLVTAFTQHLQARYGAAEVKTWYFEVWNEPNYSGFWPNTDQATYFRLYDASAAAIKSVNPAFRVGGPATAGAGWVPEFIQHTVAAKAPLDFISTHTYAVSQGFLDADGKADLVLSSDANAIVGDVRNVHRQIAESTQPGLPLHMTEWSSSYSSRDPVHDSYTNAAFVLEKLKQTEGLATSMSYWTYSDLFEENGPPPAAFHGGFGLLTRDDIPKATYFAYKYLNELGPTELANQDAASWLTSSPDGAQALVWDYSPLHQEEGNKAFFRRLHPAAEAVPVELKLKHLKPGRYTLHTYRTGYRRNDAYSLYIDMGLPKDLAPAQLSTLLGLAADRPEETSVVQVGASGSFQTIINMHKNDLVLVLLTSKDF